VRLTAYGGEADDLPASVLQRYLDRIAAGGVSLGPARVYPMDAIRQAHDDLEHNRTAGKLVVLTGPAEGAAP
jgi:NADPH:quinone reductase-like Zn-dependent oxidoreductase